MILCLDSGNTRIKWGVHDGQDWLAQGALTHAETAGLSELALRWPACHRVLLANVAGTAAADAIQRALGPLADRLTTVAASATACGVVNLYDHPARLGVDRWCALIGARAQFAGALLVVMAGTATTVDSLSASGEFLGGLILPGISLMRDSLGRGTAGLDVQLGEHRDFPRCTEDAIYSGVLEAQAGAIERAFARLPGNDRRCLLAGGNAGLLAGLLEIPCLQVDNLPLLGLQEIAKHS